LVKAPRTALTTEMTIEPSTAHQKPSTVNATPNCEVIHSVSRSSRALMTSSARPSEMMITARTGP